MSLTSAVATFDRARLGRPQILCDHEDIAVLFGQGHSVVAAEIDVIELFRPLEGLRPQRDLMAVGPVDLRPAVHVKTARLAPPLGQQGRRGGLHRLGRDKADVMDLDVCAGLRLQLAHPRFSGAQRRAKPRAQGIEGSRSSADEGDGGHDRRPTPSTPVGS
jgi:hypothetical protein